VHCLFVLCTVYVMQLAGKTWTFCKPMRCERDEGKLEAREREEEGEGGRGEADTAGNLGMDGHGDMITKVLIGLDWRGWWRWARVRCCVRLGGAYPVMGRYEVHGVEIVLSEQVRSMRTSVVIRGRLQATAGGACEGVASSQSDGRVRGVQRRPPAAR